MLVDLTKQEPKKTRVIRRLKDIKYFEVAFVPAGANGVDFLVCKSAEEPMSLTVECVTKAQDTLTQILKALGADGKGEVAAELRKSLLTTLSPLLGADGQINMVQELKSMCADLGTVTSACADIGVIDALDGIAGRAQSLLKMAEATPLAATDKAAGDGKPAPTGAPPASSTITTPKPPNTLADNPGAVPAAATQSSSVAGGPSGLLGKEDGADPVDLTEAPGTEGDAADLTEKDAEGLTDEMLAKATPAAGKPNAHKSPPKGYPKDKGQYADPENYKYPIDTEEHVRAAMAYFSKPKNRAGYSSEEVKAVWGRIVKAAKKLGIEVKAPAAPGKAEEKCATCGKSGTPAVAAIPAGPTAVAAPPVNLGAGADVIGTFKTAMNELLAPVVAQINKVEASVMTVKGELEGKIVEVAKAQTALSVVPAPAVPGVGSGVSASKAGETPVAGKPKTTWPTDFNEGNEPSFEPDVLCD